MPGSIVAEVTDHAFDITKLGNTLVLNTREGTIGSYNAMCINGGWNSASLSVKKLYGAGPPVAFGTPVAITADSADEDLDTTGLSGLVVTVDTVSGTASSYITLRLTCKGDRLDSVNKRGDGVFGPTSGGDFTSPPMGGGM